jgi:hypothetical protein
VSYGVLGPVVHVDRGSPPVRAETGAPATQGQWEIAASTDGTRIYDVTSRQRLGDSIAIGDAEFAVPTQ